ncbi:MAG: hypothetical protein L3J13_06305 [Devosiaceae bacterium]|nr:hypothetical protein [Devosiaceae bacterium]
MEALLPIIMQLVGGGAGGAAVSKLMSGGNMSAVLGMVTGAVGGVGGTFLAGMIPGLSGMLGKATDMAGAASDAAGATAASGLDFGALAGQGATGLVGGGILTGVVSLIKGVMNK